MCMLVLSEGKGLANQKCQRSHRGAEPRSVYVCVGVGFPRVHGFPRGPWMEFGRSADSGWKTPALFSLTAGCSSVLASVVNVGSKTVTAAAPVALSHADRSCILITYSVAASGT